MKKLWTHREIDAPAETLWDLLTDPQRWADWGPTVVRAELRSEQFEQGATALQRLERIATQEKIIS